MDPNLRRAWVETVTPDDYEEHMASIGQAQAGADLMRHLLEVAHPPAGSGVVVAAAGTGQWLDFLDVGILRPFHLTFTDLSRRFLDRLERRLAQYGLHAIVLEDDIENTALEQCPDLFLATLLLEHIDWRRGVEEIARLRPAACGITIQQNPPQMTSAVTPGRMLPPSLARAVEHAHPTLVAQQELVSAFADRGYKKTETCSREVSDGKRLIGVLFQPA